MNNLYDIIIIGAGPAGASAAIYAGRAMLRTLIIDSNQTGGQIRITSEVVNYPGIPQISGEEYSQNLEKQIAHFGVDTVTAQVQDLELEGDVKKIITDVGTFESLGVIVATGAQPRPAGFEGENKYRGRGVSYCATCDGEFFKDRDVFVIGGGYAAAEETMFLTRYARKVHMILRGDDFSCPISLADHVKKNPKVEIYYNTTVLALEGDDLPRKILLQDNITEETRYFAPEDPSESFGVFVFVGYEPQSKLYKGILDMDKGGYLLVDENMKSNIDGVHVAGDIRPKKLRQLVTAVSDGAIASTELEKYVQTKKEEMDIVITRTEPAQREKEPAPRFFSDELTAQLAPILDRFKNKVTMVSIAEEKTDFSEKLDNFVLELAGLDDKLEAIALLKGENPELESALTKVERYPAIVLLDHEKNDMQVYYNTLPSGHEFNSFVLALYNTAGPGQPLEQETLDQIQALDAPLHVEVGISLTCTMCPDVVQGMQLIAAHNPNIKVNIIDVFEFPEFREKHNIMSVPAVVINDSDPIFGKKNVQELIGLLKQV